MPNLMFCSPRMCRIFQFHTWSAYFLVTLMLVHVSSKNMCLQRQTHLKAHRISNDMVLELPTQRQGKINPSFEGGGRGLGVDL